MFANQLGFLRRSQQLTQEQLADKLGVTKQSVSNWKNGNIMPSVEMLEKIADYFNVSVDYLLGRNVFEQSSLSVIDVTGLTADEISHIKLLVDDLREHKI